MTTTTAKLKVQLVRSPIGTKESGRDAGGGAPILR